MTTGGAASTPRPSPADGREKRRSVSSSVDGRPAQPLEGQAWPPHRCSTCAGGRRLAGLSRVGPCGLMDLVELSMGLHRQSTNGGDPRGHGGWRRAIRRSSSTRISPAEAGERSLPDARAELPIVSRGNADARGRQGIDVPCLEHGPRRSFSGKQTVDHADESLLDRRARRPGQPDENHGIDMKVEGFR